MKLCPKCKDKTYSCDACGGHGWVNNNRFVKILKEVLDEQ